MADNVDTKVATNIPVATDVVTYSGDPSQNVQLLRQVHVTGSEDAKTVVPVTGNTGSAIPGAAVACGGTDGTNLRALKTDTGGILAAATDPFGVNADASSQSGSISAKLRYIATTGHPITGSVATAGDVAHGATDSGNPIKQGARAIAHGTNPTAVAAAQRTDILANRAGIPFVMGGHPNIQTTRLNFASAQTDVSLVGTIATGLKVVCTGFQVTLDNASTGFPSVRLGFGATNTPTTTGVIGSHPGIAAGGGFGRGDGSGIIGIGGDGEELRVTSVGAASAGGVDVVVTWYTIES